MRLTAAAGVLALCGALLLGCGGGSGGSAQAKVGDCIDSSNQVVDCSSSDATDKLVSDQNAPNATACIVIGTPPQHEVSVGSGRFCAQPLK